MQSHRFLYLHEVPFAAIVEHWPHGGPVPDIDGVGDDIRTGATVLDIRGAVLGALAEVYLDNQTGRCRWGVVSLDGHRRVLPLTQARVEGITVWVPVTTERVLSAPHRDPATALTAYDEHDLDRHYAITDQDGSGRAFVVSIAQRPAGIGGAQSGRRPSRLAPHRGWPHRAGAHAAIPSRSTLGGPGVCPPAVTRC